PISPLRINRNVVRITGFFMVLMIALYAYTGAIYFIIAIGVDYFIRTFTPLPYSPFSWLAQQVVKLLRLPWQPQDKAPKIFAARVGWLFALTTALLYPFYPTASLVVGLTLMGFALLESLFDFCVGCVVYTYVVLPLYGEKSAQQKGASANVPPLSPNHKEWT
ncbi:MAG: DUF4395 domain-containing protein, partial [Caldilineaceae bacterium]|nr:DUF4395 domain-containing protein [Caldilineaceae bacterium]